VRIGIDYTSAVQQGAGIGRLTRNVVQALAQIDQKNEYVLLVQGRDLPHPMHVSPAIGLTRNRASGIPNPNFSEVRTRLSQRWWTRIWHRLRLPIAVEWVTGPLRVFHSPDFALPPLRGDTRAIVTVHDLSFMRLPHCFEPSLLQYLRGSVPRAVRRADWVLADSESTCRDLVELLDVPQERISVLYPGVEPRFCPLADPEELARVRHKYGLPARFILSVGTLQPRKNYATLIEAFSQLADPDLSLVVVGQRGWLYDDLFALVRKKGMERVHFPGFVEDSDLPAIYNLAEVFALPSLYEGFGIPPLEAMACGVPVITADNSSFPEVVGDAGLLVDASDVQALVSGLGSLLNDATLRQTMTARGLRQAMRFTWQDAAEALLSTYMRVGQA
jgi:glycosyltransferase involved in cell wall biosynthesis